MLIGWRHETAMALGLKQVAKFGGVLARIERADT